MDDRHIKSLLQKTDAAVPPPVGDRALADDVRRACRRRNVIAGVAASLVAVLAIAIVLVQFRGAVPQGPHAPPSVASRPSQPPAPVVVAMVDLGALREDANLHAQVAERLWAAEHDRQKLARLQVAPDPLAVIGRQRDRTALIAVDRADSYVKQGQFTQAARDYTQAIRLFPETHWAAVARQRLAQIENRKDG